MRLIDEVWAVVAEDPNDNTEGVVAMQTDIGWLPLIAADKDRLENIKEWGRQMSAVRGQPFKLIKLSTREVVEDIDGRVKQ